MQTYPSPLAGSEWLTAPELAARLFARAGTLTAQVRRRYERLGIDTAYADRAHIEHLAHMAYAYLAVTGDYPSWVPSTVDDYAVPAWVDAL